LLKDSILSFIFFSKSGVVFTYKLMVIALLILVGCSKKSLKEREQLFNALAPQEKIQKSVATYAQLCARCHGEKGKGRVGPSLIDSSWVHSNSEPESIARIIRNGVVQKGMPSWGHVLGEGEALSLAQWIVSLSSSESKKTREAEVNPNE